MVMFSESEADVVPSWMVSVVVMVASLSTCGAVNDGESVAGSSRLMGSGESWDHR